MRFDGTPDPTRTVNRSQVEYGSEMTFFLEEYGDPNWTMIHEMMHLSGQPDEYAEFLGTGSPPGPAGVVTYALPTPGALEVTYLGTATQGDETLPLPYLGTSSSAPGAFIWALPSLMGQNGDWRCFAESFFWIPKEVEYVFDFEGTPVAAKIVVA